MVWFSNPFFWIGYTFFWFWVLVKCKKWFIFCIWFWIFIYFILYWLIAWHPPILYRSSLFYLAPFFYLASPFIRSVKTKLIFICHPFVPAPLLLLLLPMLQVVIMSSSSLVVVRRLFVPAKCVRFMKICKTHDKCYYYYDIYFEHAPVFLCPHCPLKLSSEKKNNYFLIHFAFIHFKKSVV